MYKITKHPILEIQENQQSTFIFEGQKVTGDVGFTIAAALHQSGQIGRAHV